MKLRHVVAFTSAALLSFGALAGGEQHSSAGAAADPAVVRQAQEKLAAEGFNPGTADGRLGQRTRQGLKDRGCVLVRAGAGEERRGVDSRADSRRQAS